MHITRQERFQAGTAAVAAASTGITRGDGLRDPAVDVCVYGGTAIGVLAAVASSRR
jgi:hypothetical protein